MIEVSAACGFLPTLQLAKAPPPTLRPTPIIAKRESGTWCAVMTQSISVIPLLQEKYPLLGADTSPLDFRDVLEKKKFSSSRVSATADGNHQTEQAIRVRVRVFPLFTLTHQV